MFAGWLTGAFPLASSPRLPCFCWSGLPCWSLSLSGRRCRRPLLYTVNGPRRPKAIVCPARRRHSACCCASCRPDRPRGCRNARGAVAPVVRAAARRAAARQWWCGVIAARSRWPPCGSSLPPRAIGVARHARPVPLSGGMVNAGAPPRAAAGHRLVRQAALARRLSRRGLPRPWVRLWDDWLQRAMAGASRYRCARCASA